MMETNIGIAQQVFRVLLGLAIIAYAYLNLCCTNLVVALLIGAFFFGTGGLGYCPFFALLKKHDDHKKRRKQGKAI